MFLIQGPHPLLQTSIILPSPAEGNTDKLTSSIQILRAADGTVYSYVKSKRGRRAFRFDFTLSSDKADELTAFVGLYGGRPVRVQDHNGVATIAFMTLNPFEKQGAGRAKGLPGGEVYHVSIEFEEKI